MSTVWLELDDGALAHNAKILRAAMPEHCQLMAALKAEAYGHGAVVHGSAGGEHH